MLGQSKVCTKCKCEKELDQFTNNSQHPDGLNYWCRTCNAEATKLWRINNPEKKRLSNTKKCLRIRYGMTLDDFEYLSKQQNYKCAVCQQIEIAKDQYGNIKRLSVDHCHKTGKIRGLLCDACNRAEGYLRSNPAIARKLADYLEKHLLLEENHD